MKVTITTLGCKVNQFESQALETILISRGHYICSRDDLSDACIINTCAVTAESVRKSRQTVRRILSRNPNAIIAVCGCWSQLNPNDAQMLGASLVSGSGDRMAFILELEKMCAGGGIAVRIDDPLARTDFETLPSGTLKGRTRAMLKIQDGCSNFCTYCIIPYIRGPARSLPQSEAILQAKKLANKGIREIVITGIEISSYGAGHGNHSSLLSLTAQLSVAVPHTRLRLGSLEPRIITEQFCVELSQLSNLCPHFHLSLQSGCDSTLERMGRKYNTESFWTSLSLLREYFPDCGITADLIVGFPGETEDEFSRTLSFIEKCAFSSMHIFPYSPRPSTIAADMPGQVPDTVKKSRAANASVLAEKMKLRFLDSMINSRQSVLFEGKSESGSSGYSGNYCRVEVAENTLENQIYDVLISERRGDILIGGLFFGN